MEFSSLASFLGASADVDEVGLKGGDLLADDAELVGAHDLKLQASACQQVSPKQQLLYYGMCWDPEASAAQRDHDMISHLPRHPPSPGTLLCSPGQACLLPETRPHWALPVSPEPATLMGVLPFLKCSLQAHAITHPHPSAWVVQA